MATRVQETAAYPGIGTATASTGGGTLVESTPLTSIATFSQTEPSGLVFSRQHAGILWTHRDGARPTLYASLWSAGRPVPNGVSGTTHKAIGVTGWTAVDFEDITIDPSHNLWLADMGNNSGTRTNLKIVKVAEPNPTAVSTVAAAAVYPIVWPAGAAESDTDDPDCEAIFWAKGGASHPYVLTKHRNVASGVPGCYRMNSLNTGSNNTLLFVADVTIPSMPAAPYNQDYRPTSVDVTQDGEYMVITYAGWRSVTYQCTNLALTGDAWVSNILANPIDYTPYSSTSPLTFVPVEGFAFGNTYQHDGVMVGDSNMKFYRHDAAYMSMSVPSGALWTTAPTVGNIQVATCFGQVGSTEGLATQAPSGLGWTLCDDGTTDARAFKSTDCEVAEFWRPVAGNVNDHTLGVWTNSTGKDIAVRLVEWTGVDLASPIAAVATAVTSSSTSQPSGTTGTLPSGSHGAQVGIVNRNVATHSAPTNGFTMLGTGTTPSNPATPANAVSYSTSTKNAVAGGATSSTTLTLSTARPGAGVIVVLRDAGTIQTVELPSIPSTASINAIDVSSHDWSNTVTSFSSPSAGVPPVTPDSGSQIMIGRLLLPGPKEPQFTRDGLAFSGLIHAESQTVTNARRNQITGLKGQLVPVVWTPGEVNGFYRVTDADVTVHYVTSSRSAIRYSVQLEFVGASLDFESTLVGNQVPNIHGIIGTPWWTAPSYASHEAQTTGAFFNRFGEDGYLTGKIFTVAPSWARFMARAGDWFINDCKVIFDGEIMEGTKPPRVNTDEGSHVLSNGTIRVSTASNGPSTFNIDVWSDDAWHTKTFAILIGGNPTIAPEEVAILHNRNLPQAAGLRFMISGRVYVDVSLRRGAAYATVTISRRTASLSLGIEADTATAATAITGGIRATSNDANGNRFVMSSPQAFTPDLTQGGISTPGVSSKFTFNVGYEIGGSSATTYDTADAVVAQSMWHTDETVRPVRL